MEGVETAVRYFPSPGQLGLDKTPSSCDAGFMDWYTYPLAMAADFSPMFTWEPGTVLELQL